MSRINRNSGGATSNLDDIIKLQLKKPRHWNWELSTSRSSPHIPLPVIQLYDDKKNLLVETKAYERRSWHVSDYKSPRSSYSKTIDKMPVKINYYNPVKRSSTISSLDTQPQKYKLNTEEKIRIKEHILKKSRSDIFSANSSRKNSELNLLNRSSTKCNKYALKEPENKLNKSKSDMFSPYNSRKNSSDTESTLLYRNSTKCNKYSAREPEQKFYEPKSNILNNSGRNSELNLMYGNSSKKYEDLSTFRNKRNKEKYKEHTMTDVNQNKYTLRSCSAGTLLIKEDPSKSDVRRRRRRKTSEIRNNSSSSDSENQKITIKENKNNSRNYHGIVRRYTDLSLLSDARKNYEKNKNNSYSDIQTADKKSSNKSTDLKYGLLESTNNKLSSKKSDVFNRCSEDSSISMGANFSRHSSKGLSGRRCQSISNICNSKDHFLDPSGREVDAAYKFCNSLPSPNGTVYNNNYEHKPITKKTSLPHTVSEHNVIDPEHQAHHPLQWKFTDTQTCDQGYGSERSPEEEIPPPIPSHECDYEHTIDFCYSSYPFILPENTFEVELVKGSRGLGLSVCGGIDSDGSWPGLLRIKRLFPHQPAAASGLLQIGDLLLEANGVSLTGLSNYEALEVLRMTPNQVLLLVCRPPPEVLSTMSPVSDVPPPPPRRATSPPACMSKLSEDIYETEFEIVLTKIHGSLGFTLCKEEDGVVGHYVRALVREPAISDGRIQPGDKIVAVNGVEISNMSHEQAVAFLRQCDNDVLLRLLRELDTTPADLSPTDITPNSSFRPKPHLRQEAVDMLSDLAARKLCQQSPCTSPRHLRYDPGVHFESLCSETDDDKAVRPCFLDLYNPNQTPVAVRKSKFNLSLAHNAYELNNLDPEMLDAPNLNCAGYDDEVADEHDFPDEPVSMPPLSTTKSAVFSHKKPVYASAHAPMTSVNTSAAVPVAGTSTGSSTSGASSSTVIAVPVAGTSGAVDEVDSSKGEEQGQGKASDNQWTGVVFSAEKDLIENDAQVLNIELNRGWNSRLGFSLQEVDGCTCVSAVYSDSVAAKDGRIRPGDCLLKVNDERVENMKTADVIDLLRIIRGPICIIVLRRKHRLD